MDGRRQLPHRGGPALEMVELDELTENKPIWSRRPSPIEDAEYVDFYKALTSDGDEPLGHVHFKAEGGDRIRLDPVHFGVCAAGHARSTTTRRAP